MKTNARITLTDEQAQRLSDVFGECARLNRAGETPIIIGQPRQGAYGEIDIAFGIVLEKDALKLQRILAPDLESGTAFDTGIPIDIGLHFFDEAAQ